MTESLVGGKYEIDRVLGRGAMGTVYAARNVRTGRRVAIKSLNVPGAMAADDPDLLRLEQEARIAGSLESQHVAPVLDIDRDPESGAPFLVMELLDGEDLDALLERVGPLSPDTALRIAAQACLGLDAAHAAGVVHRDIKPANLFLARREGGEVVVKILDFGLAKIRRLPPDRAVAGLAAPAVSITATGQMLGSPLFMSPEQVEGSDRVDARSDVFSMGATLYAMLTGAAPHAATKSFVELLHRLTTEPPRPAREVAPWLPAGVAALVDRATRLPQGERFESAAALREAILALLPGGAALRQDMLAGRGDAPPPSRSPVQEPDPLAATGRAEAVAPARKASRATPIVIGLAVLLLGAVIAVMLVWR
jgi:serine/threonine protein kinase